MQERGSSRGSLLAIASQNETEVDQKREAKGCNNIETIGPRVRFRRWDVDHIIDYDW